MNRVFAWLGAASVATAVTIAAPLGPRPVPTEMSARAARHDAASSTNWAGYSVTEPGATFTDVRGSWVQPTAKCLPGTSYSSFWIGLGGFVQGAPGLEQIGTSADCDAGGQPTYYAWHELIPAPAVRDPIPVAPGDPISAEVRANGSTVSLTLLNEANGISNTTEVSVPSPDFSSAEWIAEAPSNCSPFIRNGCRVQPLAEFGTVAFSAASATANGHAGSISDLAWTASPVSLTAASGEPAATPSALSADGSSFTVTWQSTGGPPLQLSVVRFDTAPERPRAGRTFTASMFVDATSPAALAQAKTSCRATISGNPLQHPVRAFAAGTARCVWKIPVSAKGKVIAGSVAASLHGTTIARTFSKPIR